MIIVHFWWLITSATNAFYGIVSGWLGDVTVFGSAAAGLRMYYKHTRCHVDTCNKHGKYPFQHYKLCEDHHPEVPSKVSHLHIKQLHKAYTKSK